MSAPAALPASGFLNTAAIATRRSGGLARAPYSLWISSTKVTVLRMSMVRSSLRGFPQFALRGNRGRSASLNQRYRIAQHIDAGARPDAIFGKVAAERARAGHGVIGADEMPGDGVQTRAPGQLALDIGGHRLEHLSHGRKARRLAKNVGIDRQQPPRILICRASEHHAVNVIEVRLRLGEAADPAIDNDGHIRHRLLQPIDPVVVERRDVAIFPWRQTGEPGLAGVHDKYVAACGNHGARET